MEKNAIIKCPNVIDDSFCTVIILKYKVYRDDTGKLFGRLLVLKHKVENFLKEIIDEDLLFQNPVLQRAKDGLLDLFQGLTALCSGISPSREMLRVPELASYEKDPAESFEMKFVKGNNLSDLWLCYVDNGPLLNLLKRLSERYENDELEPFIFYPRIGEHVYFKQGQNIFRGIVQEYVILDDNESDERVDVKILNMDNSDVVVLPQNSIFQMDKDGVELPMQCVLCSMQETDASTDVDSDSRPSTDLSMGMLKKHKLSVTFHGKKEAIKNLPIEAQCVTITISADKMKDKKNSFNVNSKEFVPRNSIPNNDTSTSSSGVSEADSKSVETTRSSSPGSSQGDIVTKEAVTHVNEDRTKNQSNASVSNAPVISVAASASAEISSSVSTANHYGIKDRTTDSIKSNVINHAIPIRTDANSVAPANVFRPPSAHPHSHDRERNAYNRYGSSKIIDSAMPPPKGGKSVSAIVDKLKNVASISSPSNETRTKVTVGSGGPPSSSPYPSQTQSPANMPPNAQMPPYLFLPPGPVHFPGQYMPIPASAATAASPAHPPQQLGSSMPLFLPPYPPAYMPPAAAAAHPPPVSAHSQAATAYHMPPTASSPYQPYMQPMAVAPFFSQPPFSQQFYQTSHLHHAWSYLPPSFHVGGGGGGGVFSHPGGGGNVNKSDVPAGPGISSKFK